MHSRSSFDDGSFDAVLLLGPLYHLPERNDRVEALREACRVLVPGGFVAAAAISRFAGLIDGLRKGWLAEEELLPAVEEELASGRHLSPPDSAFSRRLSFTSGRSSRTRSPKPVFPRWPC